MKAADNSLTDSYYKPGSALNRIWSEAPFLPRCSDNKTAARVRPREYAIRYPYMQVNRPGFVSWLVFDLDHANVFIWDDKGLPEPNLVVQNRKTKKSHLYYAISPVCTTEAARSAPIAYMKAIYEAMVSKLEADPAYSGPVAKTPGHPWWHTWEIHAHTYDLGELADHVELPSKPKWATGPDLESVSHSRHCLLFEMLRFYAYSIVNRERKSGSFSNFCRFLEVYAFNKNNFKPRGFDMNLSAAQVKATVKSVARWTWDNYSGCSQCHKGVMGLSAAVPLAKRQQLSARRTHEVRREATELKLRAACIELAKRQQKFTYRAISTLSGMSRQTVASYQTFINKIQQTLTQATKIIALEGLFSSTQNVKHGVHQIPAEVARVSLTNDALAIVPRDAPAPCCVSRSPPWKKKKNE